MLQVTQEQLETIRRGTKGTVVDDIELAENVNGDYESSKYISMHDVVVLDTGTGDFYRLCWDVTKEDDPELLYETLVIHPVRPVPVNTVVYKEL